MGQRHPRGAAVTTAVAEANGAYLERCLRDPRLRGVMGRVALPGSLADWLAGRLLARPLFLSNSELARASDDVARVLAVLASLPQRLFDGDLHRYCAAVGMDERRATALARFAAAAPTHYGRADLYHDGRGLRLLEFNVASDLGGIDDSEVNRLLLREEVFAEFAREHRLAYVNACDELAACLRAAGAAMGASDARVALLWAGAPAALLPMGRSLAEALRARGLEVLVGDVRDVRTGGAGPRLHGRRFDVVLRYFTIDDVLADAGVAAAAGRLEAAHRCGRLAWWTPLDSSLVSTKAALALLSDPRWRGAYTTEEAALCDRVVPWTRLLHPAAADTALRDRCERHRERLLLKPLTESSGRGIVAGWQTSPRRWRQALARGHAAGCVVQARIVPRAEPVAAPDSGTVEDWDAVYGLFHTPRGHGGGFVRAARRTRRSAVVSHFHDPNTRSGVLFAGGAA